MTAERWLQLLDDSRLGARARPGRAPETSRTDFQRDFDRVVFSTAFRRLHDKTQVFPLPENDLVHSRLTHSLEVSCVGRSLGTLVGQDVCADHPGLAARGIDPRAFGDIVAAACVAHDLGNPPFGHAGEDAIGAWFRTHPEVITGLAEGERADLERFEGNAQGFRIVTRLQIPENPGLQLTRATLAAFTKYPRTSGPRPREGDVTVAKHGVFRAEVELLADVMAGVGLRPSSQGGLRCWPRHPLAFLVEAADDICYSILDIEDGFRLGHVPFDEVEAHLHAVVRTDPTYRRRAPTSPSDRKEAVAYLRAKAINHLASQVREAFRQRSQVLLEGSVREPLSDTLPSSEALSQVIEHTRRTCYRARDVVEIELAGYEVLSALLDAFVPAVLTAQPTLRQRKLLALLPEPPSDEASAYERLLTVTDHVSGMTDRYAISTYRKLHGISLRD